MSSRPDIASIAHRARTVAAGGPVTGVHFIGGIAAFVLGEEALLLVPEEAAEQRIPVHAGAILSSVSDGSRVLTAGDDGKVMATGRGGSEIIAADPAKRWIDHVTVAPDGTVAWSIGKQAFVQSRDGLPRALELPSTAGGLAFAPKGLRLAIAHYNGATLWFPNAKAQPGRLTWRGSHLSATFSPDSRFLVTAMQEQVLHGWRIADRQDMRMQGYTARVRSLDWTADGKWLATSGASQVVLWPFQGKSGPMGKAPQLLASAGDGEERVEVVACHPRHPILAAGFTNGLVLLVRVEDGAEILVKAPAASPVTALAWNADGNSLAFGTEDGECGILRDLG